MSAQGWIFLNDKYPPSGGVHWARITVEKGAKIGGGVVVLPGVVIGESALIGAGSVVTKSVPAGEIWCGNPAKKIKMKIIVTGGSGFVGSNTIVALVKKG